MSKVEHFGLDFPTFARLIDRLHDEIIIYDNNYRMLYVNRACERHYGFTQKEMVNLPYWKVVKEHQAWNRSILPEVYKHKRPVKQRQKTYLGLEVLTIAIPLFDSAGEIEYVLLSIRDEFHKNTILTRDELVEADNTNESIQSDTFIYHSDLMQQVIDAAGKVAQLTSPCLILGESGCGKSQLAKLIHSQGNRAEHPFVVVNCAAIPQELVESELFGHVKGAFSGAIQARGGLFAKAKGGTLFLDEISELPLAMQAKLLHAVQEMEYRPVGSSETVKANVRILAASNRNLEKMVTSGAFRQDLFFRLNVFDITIPPLRERPEDIRSLLFYFLHKYAEQHQTGRRFSPEALEVLTQYAWPGNVRELAHFMERIVVTASSDLITVDTLPSSIYETIHSPQQPSLPTGSFDEVMDSVEKTLILNALKKHGTSRRVASALGITQTKASRLIRKHSGSVS